jgi:tetratricopeptide (TPR) repeat protein
MSVQITVDAASVTLSKSMVSHVADYAHALSHAELLGHSSNDSHWLRAMLCLLMAFAPAVFGCTQSSDQASSWEKEDAMAAEAFQQGRYAEAESLWTSALKKAEAFEPGDPRLAISLGRLAFLYGSQLKYADAEPLYQRVLTIREKALGPTHPDVAKTLYKLARLYQAQDKYAEAEPLYQRALAITEKVLGPGHHDVAMILESYVTLLREANRADEAAQLLAAHATADRDKTTLPICPD